jgi:hypothetical protein
LFKELDVKHQPQKSATARVNMVVRGKLHAGLFAQIKQVETDVNPRY